MKKTIAIGALILGFLMPHSVLAQNKAEQSADGLQTSAGIYFEVTEDTLDEAEPSDSVYEESGANFSGGDRTGWLPDVLEDAIDAMIPISICVILPLAIVFMVFFFRRKHEQERARLIEKMIEKDMDVSAFIKAEKAGKDDNNGENNTTGNFIKMLAWGLVLLCGGICVIIYQFGTGGYGRMMMYGWIAGGIGLALTITAIVWRQAIRKDELQSGKRD